MSLNQCILMGRLTKDPEQNQTSNGKKICRFSLAIDRNYKNTSGNHDTDFIDCIAWGGTADFITTCFQKGKMIAISGALRISSWETEDGNKRQRAEIHVHQAYFCGDGNRSAFAAEERTRQRLKKLGMDDRPWNPGSEPAPINDDLPF